MANENTFQQNQKPEKQQPKPSLGHLNETYIQYCCTVENHRRYQGPLQTDFNCFKLMFEKNIKDYFQLGFVDCCKIMPNRSAD